jgi:hypothetical protein
MVNNGLKSAEVTVDNLIWPGAGGVPARNEAHFCHENCVNQARGALRSRFGSSDSWFIKKAWAALLAVGN